MSIYGERHKIFHDHHVETKAKLDSILAKNSQIEVNNDAVEGKLDTGNASHASIDGKITACNTGAVVVSSSALPAGAASEASLAAMNAKIVTCDSGNVVVASSALPAGAASESSLAGLNAKVVAVNTGACVVSSSALPAGAASESSLAALSAKVTACDSGATVVSSCALPSGASVAAKQDEIKTLITATNTALAGTLTVSAGAATLTKSASTPISAQSINGQSSHTSAEIDVSAARHISVIANSSDTASSHEVDILISNVSGGSFFESSHSGFYLAGNFHMLVSDVPYKYIKLRIKNGNSDVAVSGTFTAHLLTSD
jgi:hypothetical protein|tara:strand:+ start:1197 stop:2144 length:948 start_codon:yes stop_codon:yes gene_type:complete